MLSALDILAIILCTAGLGFALALEIRSHSEKWGFRIFVSMTAIPFLLTIGALFVWAAVSIVRPGLVALLQAML